MDPALQQQLLHLSENFVLPSEDTEQVAEVITAAVCLLVSLYACLRVQGFLRILAVALCSAFLLYTPLISLRVAFELLGRSASARTLVALSMLQKTRMALMQTGDHKSISRWNRGIFPDGHSPWPNAEIDRSTLCYFSSSNNRLPERTRESTRVLAQAADALSVCKPAHPGFSQGQILSPISLPSLRISTAVDASSTKFGQTDNS